VTDMATPPVQLFLSVLVDEFLEAHSHRFKCGDRHGHSTCSTLPVRLG